MTFCRSLSGGGDAAFLSAFQQPRDGVTNGVAAGGASVARENEPPQSDSGVCDRFRSPAKSGNVVETSRSEPIGFVPEEGKASASSSSATID